MKRKSKSIKSIKGIYKSPVHCPAHDQLTDVLHIDCVDEWCGCIYKTKPLGLGTCIISFGVYDITRDRNVFRLRTPPITKFFKRNPDIKAKHLDAVVSITNISTAKSFANVQHSNYNNCIEDTEVNKKPSTKPVHSKNTAAVTVLSDSQHVGNLVQIDESLVDDENEKNGSLDSSHKQMSANGAKKCLFDQCDAEKSRPLSQSEDKSCVSFENGREEKQDAETKLNSDCSDNVTVKKPDISECEMESENKTKLVVRKSCDTETVHSVDEKNTEQSNQAISSLSSNGQCAAVGNSRSDQDKTVKNEDSLDADESGNESSDEELFNPVTFLSEARIKPDIRTPDKGTTPITGSPLAPVSPYIAQARELTARLKYSLDTLLSEKPDKAIVKDEALLKLQLSLKQSIEDGKNASLEDDAKNELQDEKPLLPIHQKELKKYKSADKGFMEETQGINVFSRLKEPEKYENGCSRPFSHVQTATEFTEFLYQRTDLEIRELLCCDWIAHHYLVHPCPPHVVQWLFHVLCYHIDSHAIKASFNTFWSMLKLGDDKENGKELSWLPTVEDVIKVFNNYGADLNSLLTNVCETMDIGKNLLLPIKDEAVDANEEEEPTYFPLVNLNRLIQFVTSLLDRYPQNYSTKDIEDLVLLFLCVSLDTRMQICHHDIKTSLQAMYSAVEPAHWIDEVLKMSSVISHIDVDHRNKLYVIRLQPYSNRGRDMKKLAALKTLAFLLNSEAVVDVKCCIQSDADANNDKELTNSLEVLTQLESLLQEVKINDDIDYCQLYTIIELLDVVVGAENLQLQEKAIVERITKKLRSVHSGIEDPRGMFISRTKVKNLILRTVTKFVYMTQGKKGVKPQKSITKFFAEGNSDLHIETLKDDEIMEEEEDEPESQESQESLTSSCILDPLSQTNNDDDEGVLASQEFPA